MPLRSQGYCGVGRGLSGLLWVWCNGRGPHLKFRQEPQGFAPFLTPIQGSLQSCDRRVRPRLGLRHGTPLASRGVHGVAGHLWSCIWNLWVFSGRCTGVSVPYRVATSSTGWRSKRCPGMGFLSRSDREIGVFRKVAPPTRLCLEFPREKGLILTCDGKFLKPFQTKQGNGPSCQDQ